MNSPIFRKSKWKIVKETYCYKRHNYPIDIYLVPRTIGTRIQHHKTKKMWFYICFALTEHSTPQTHIYYTICVFWELKNEVQDFNFNGMVIDFKMFDVYTGIILVSLLSPQWNIYVLKWFESRNGAIRYAHTLHCCDHRFYPISTAWNMTGKTTEKCMSSWNKLRKSQSLTVNVSLSTRMTISLFHFVLQIDRTL